MAKELPKRSEVPVEFTWKLEDMYADAAAMRVGADVCNIFFLSIHI